MDNDAQKKRDTFLKMMRLARTVTNLQKHPLAQYLYISAGIFAKCLLTEEAQVAKLIADAAYAEIDANYAEAVEKLDIAISMAPEDLSILARFYKASVLTAQGQFDDAKDILSDLTGINSDIHHNISVDDLNTRNALRQAKDSLKTILLPTLLWHDYTINNLADNHERLASAKRQQATPNTKEAYQHLSAAYVLYELAEELHEAVEAQHEDIIPSSYVSMHNCGRVQYQRGLYKLSELPPIWDSTDENNASELKILIQSASGILRNAELKLIQAKDKARAAKTMIEELLEDLRSSVDDSGKPRRTERDLVKLIKDYFTLQNAPITSDIEHFKELFISSVDNSSSKSGVEFWLGVITRDEGTVAFRRSIVGVYQVEFLDNAKRKREKRLPRIDSSILAGSLDSWRESISFFQPTTSDGQGNNRNNLLGAKKAALVQAKLNRGLQLEKELKRNPQDVHRKFIVDNEAFRLLEWMPDSDTQTDGYSSSEERLITQICKNDTDYYERYSHLSDKSTTVAPADTERAKTQSGSHSTNYANTLNILRDWGSSIPLLGSELTDTRGGGYFIKWMNAGLVLDPGFDFLRNFNEANFHIEEVNAIAISHNHDDHNGDFYNLDNLYYEVFKRSLPEESNSTSLGYGLIADKDSFKRIRDHFVDTLNDGKDQPDQMLWRQELSTKKKLHLDLFNYYLPIKIDALGAEHGREVSGALSLSIDLHNFQRSLSNVSGERKIEPVKDFVSLFYTGDTSNTPQYTERVAQFLEGHAAHGSKKKRVDILLAHISQPDLLELFEPKGRDPKRGKRDLHLGFRGVKAMIELCEPELTLIGEFWAGLGDVRLSIIQALRSHFPNRVILPTSIGLSIDLETRNVCCTECGDWIPCGKVSVTASAQKFGRLSYLCPLCCIGPQESKPSILRS